MKINALYKHRKTGKMKEVNGREIHDSFNYEEEREEITILLQAGGPRDHILIMYGLAKKDTKSL